MEGRVVARSKGQSLAICLYEDNESMRDVTDIPIFSCNGTLQSFPKTSGELGAVLPGPGTHGQSLPQRACTPHQPEQSYGS